MPLIRRVPKRGFHSPFKVMYQVVNIGTLDKLATAGKIADGKVNPEMLYKLGAVSHKAKPVKVLGDGTLKAKLEVQAHALSKSAIQKIEAAGGKTSLILQK